MPARGRQQPRPLSFAGLGQPSSIPQSHSRRDPRPRGDQVYPAGVLPASNKPPQPYCCRGMELVQQKPARLSFENLSRKNHMSSAHLPSQDAKRIYVTRCRSSGIGQPEASRVNQFRSGTVKESVDVNPWHGGWKKSHSETCDMGVSTRVDEDVCLNERECATNVRGGGTYGLQVSMDNIQFMHVLHTACYFQQLVSRRRCDEQWIRQWKRTSSRRPTPLLFLRYSLRLS